jgi:IclR family transcriptional regulator, KDG regulon repressor
MSSNNGIVRIMPEIAQTADHALAILNELGEGIPLSPAELAVRLGLNRTVVHRLLVTLNARGFVLRQGAQYRPGAAILHLAQLIEPDLRAVAGPVMRRLAVATEESIVLHIPDGKDAVVLHQVVADGHVLQVSHRIGARHSLAVSASGRAILAFSPEPLTRQVAAKAEDEATLRRSLEAVRALGYSLSHDELQEGVHGVAVPIRAGADGTATASLAALMPTMRAAGIERHVSALLEGAAQIADGLSVVRPDAGLLVPDEGMTADG